MSQPTEILKQHLEKEKDKMFRIAWKMCGNPEDAQDILQETALKALRSWHQFRGESQISTWLYRIASNTCLSKQRRKSLEFVDPSILEGIQHDSESSSMPQLKDWSNDPLAKALNDELRTKLDQAILKLPELYRMVFILRDVEGMSGEHTAKTLGITLTNVKVRLHRARMFLRNELEQYVSGFNATGLAGQSQ